MKTIIVDDSYVVRDRLGEILESIPGVELVGRVGDAQEAVSSILLKRPELVILDLRLAGGGSGIEVLRKIKRENPEMRVIVFTGYPYPQYRQKCLEEGVEAFLDKSSGFEHIQSIIQDLSEGA